ncbi:MAG: FkbM family methyltransferase [Selenomonadaceae bacterium]|nr:FkbM family methyltransferase [Selenomonadaceae bacterium]MBQ3726440.1 FkbM family methyltransferase [Selenomonadaceae bacterium]
MGANIGTTGIYFCKKLAPKLKLLAFEPDPENFKLLRVNTILNDLEDKATLVNCGLGDKFDELTMYRDLKNPGHNNFTEPKKNVPTEKIKVIPLDSYLAENKIDAAEIKYIWIDTEGFEAQVLLGAKNFLNQNAPPIFMECNQLAWKNSGKLEEMVALLKSVGYTHYILFPLPGIKFTEKLYPLDNLLILPESLKPPLGQTGDIFLIKNFA